MGYKTGMVAYRSGIESIVSKCISDLYFKGPWIQNHQNWMHVEPKSEVLQLHPNHAGDNDLRRPPGRFMFALCALRKMVETAELLMLIFRRF